jgi:hypothetical protein
MGSTDRSYIFKEESDIKFHCCRCLGDARSSFWFAQAGNKVKRLEVKGPSNRKLSVAWYTAEE